MTDVDVGGAMLWGAHCREWGHTLDQNPYPDAPGWYVKRKAWSHGWRNAVAVMAEWLQEDPDGPALDDLRERIAEHDAKARKRERAA